MRNGRACVLLVGLFSAGCTDTPADATVANSVDVRDGVGSDGQDIGSDGLDVAKLPDTTPGPGQDVDDPTELGTDDTDPTDVEPVADVLEPEGCDIVPYGDGCSCTQNADCDAGYCLLTSAGKRCAAPCVETCPAGFACLNVAGAGADLSSYCVERAIFLCMPCSEDKDCRAAGFEGLDRCITQGEDGAFCGIACDRQNPCPEGYACEPGTTVGGVDVAQCAPVDGKCECEPLFTSLGAATDCVVTSDFGSCSGQRVCTAAGLTDCDATTPKQEICNGKDENCNDVIDDIPQTTCAVPSEFGQCLGKITCIGGQELCQGTPASKDVCDGLDNDCDGATDETWPDIDSDASADCVDPDDDNDQHADDVDNCPTSANSGQDNHDTDALGDSCDTDDDGDGVLDATDCAPLSPYVFPFNKEVCDGLDNDCDTVVDEKSCDDGEPCTDDVCDPVQGCENTHNEEPCNDQNPCTVKDVCTSGACDGQFLGCNDQNPCTDDSCDKSSGCVNAPNLLPCSDGSFCSTGDSCAGGVCLSGSGVLCDDKNSCTQDVCDPNSGCVPSPIGGLCTDSNKCTSADVCVGGQCVGEFGSCDDQNPCTNDGCDPETGCTHTPTPGGSCSDNNACTKNDVCTGGECVGEEPTVGACQCQEDEDCAAQEDGDLCNGTLKCDKTSAPFKCVLNPLTVVSCAVGGGLHPSCAKSQCNAATGLCGTTILPGGGLCSDGNACTSADACNSGVCLGIPTLCDDGTACTTNGCDPGLGCAYTPVPGTPVCNDNNKCTSGDVCSGGKCGGATPVVCDDQNACTADLCLPDVGCTYTATSTGCDDKSACTVFDQCIDKACVGTPLECDDDNPCNGLETCHATLACQPGTTLVCDDGIPCTLDGCDEVVGCIAVPESELCDDRNPCTVDTCVAATGCKTTAGNQGAPCDDADGCTLSSTCSAGVCLGSGTCSDLGKICSAKTCVTLDNAAPPGIRFLSFGAVMKNSVVQLRVTGSPAAGGKVKGAFEAIFGGALQTLELWQ